MAKTIQVSTSPIGENHTCAVALQSDGSLWTYTFHHSQPTSGVEWVKLPEIPAEYLPDDALPFV